jgi:hypothetical protein
MTDSVDERAITDLAELIPRWFPSFIMLRGYTVSPFPTAEFRLRDATAPLSVTLIDAVVINVGEFAIEVTRERPDNWDALRHTLSTMISEGFYARRGRLGRTVSSLGVPDSLAKVVTKYEAQG